MVTRPRSTATRHTYPFNQLSPDQFEEMVKLLASRDERFDPNSVEWIGGPGDKGRDVVARQVTSKKLWYIQVKRWKQFGASDARAVIDDIVKNVKRKKVERPEAIIIAVSCRPTDTTRQEARKHARRKKINIVEFWDESELDDRISHNPLVRERFFGANRYPGPPDSLYLPGFTKLT